jgi:hypothetical protein
MAKIWAHERQITPTVCLHTMAGPIQLNGTINLTIIELDLKA